MAWASTSWSGDTYKASRERQRRTEVEETPPQHQRHSSAMQQHKSEAKLEKFKHIKTRQAKALLAAAGVVYMLVGWGCSYVALKNYCD
jgi:cell division septal protein FtsQ